MKYKIINVKTGKELCSCCHVITQDGEVAACDGSQGWEILPNQDIYNVTLLEMSAPLAESQIWGSSEVGYP